MLIIQQISFVANKFKEEKMLDISTLLLCIQIFIARILDVSLGTVRVMLISKEKSKIAFFVAFVEVFIWFIVARSALSENANLI